MVRLADSFTAAQVVVLLDPGVLRDVAQALSGSWHPGEESDDVRRRQLVAAARLRLYGFDADRSGWRLVTTAIAHDKARARGDADWSAGFIPALEGYEDAPPVAEVSSLATLLRRDEDLDGEVANTLALALLCDAVGVVVTRDPLAYRHRRPNDLPPRLEIATPEDLVDRLELRGGEQAWADLPWGSIPGGDAWWVPPPT